jgi:stage II sporulation protein AA (anti-sigma F factor antagonist)
VKFKTENNHLVFEFYGDVDDHYAKQVRNDIDFQISKQNPRVVIFDFKNVSFIDSTGIGLIFGRYKKLLQTNAELLLRNIPSQVDKIFRASGIYSICPKI